jgi:hypothetical protein
LRVSVASVAPESDEQQSSEFVLPYWRSAMNTQGFQSLERFLNQLVQARGVAKDPQADHLIANAVAQQPDAAYLLAQRALLMEQALDSAKTQIASLQNQLQAAQSPPAHSVADAEAWGNTPAGAPRSAVSTPAAPDYLQSTPMQQQPSAASPGFFSGGLGGTLGTVAATAAGVAGGAFLFQGIEHMMDPGGASGFMNQSGMASLEPPTERATVNNFYEARPAMTSGSALDFLASDDTRWDDGLSSV